jgi:hypothetical protein
MQASYLILCVGETEHSAPPPTNFFLGPLGARNQFIPALREVDRVLSDFRPSISIRSTVP